MKSEQAALDTFKIIDRGPDYVTLEWPNPLQSSLEDIPENEIADHIVAEDLEYYSAERKRNNERFPTITNGALHFRNIGLANLYAIYNLFRRCKDQFASGTIFVRCPVGKPHSITPNGLLNLVKFSILRVWYDAIGCVNTLKNKCRFNAPRSK